MKKGILSLIVAMACMSLAACGRGESKIEETAMQKDSEVIAIHAGDAPVYLDEARYYLYTAQATYETYYLTRNQEIDWKSEMTGGSTWETVVKGQVLDEICQRECLYALAGQSNIVLTDEMVSLFFAESSDTLLKKNSITKERLEIVFQKQKIAEKVETIMEAMSSKESANTAQNKKTKEVYAQWKKENTVAPTEAWQELRIDGHIFTSEDLTEKQRSIPETTTEKQVIFE